MFSLTLYTEYEAIQTVQGHSWTRSSNNSIFLSKVYQFFVGKYCTFIYNPQARLESEKIRCSFRWPCTQSAERSKRDSKSLDTVFE